VDQVVPGQHATLYGQVWPVIRAASSEPKNATVDDVAAGPHQVRDGRPNATGGVDEGEVGLTVPVLG
jgi:hypothetical protein